MKLSKADRPICHWSNAEIRAELEHISGLPCPPEGAPNERELWAEYEVASNFLMELRQGGDPADARCRAAEYTLQNHAHPIEQLAPHIERAMGRKLLDLEIEQRTIYA